MVRDAGGRRKEEKHMRIHINQTQCGFVIKNGCYQKMIFAGTYYYPACMGYKVVIEEMRGRVSFKEVPLKVLKEDKVFLSRVTIAEVPEGQLGVLYKPCSECGCNRPGGCILECLGTV